MTETTHAGQPSEDRIIAFLEDLHRRGDRGALAALRRVVGRTIGDIPAADRLLVPRLPTWLKDAQAAEWYLIAGLFATYPSGSWPRGSNDMHARNFGVSLSRLSASSTGGGVERRFLALLSAEREDLADHLRRLVQLLKARSIPIDYGQLLRDVQRWDYPDRPVQRRWSRAFWGARPDAATPDSTTITTHD